MNGVRTRAVEGRWRERRLIAASGYRSVMARARPSIESSGDERAGVAPVDADDGYDPVAEQADARRARARRDEGLSPADRLERLHRLCAQLATMTPARPPDRR